MNGTPCWRHSFGEKSGEGGTFNQSGTTALPSPRIKINRKASVSVHVGGATWNLPFCGGCTPMRSWESHRPALCLISLIVKHDLLHLFPQVLWLLMGSVNCCFTSALAEKSGLSFSLCVLCLSHAGNTALEKLESPATGWRLDCGSQIPTCCACWLRLCL